MATFLDPFFQALRSARTSVTRTVGAGGTAVYSGYVDNRERNPELVGDRRWRTFSELIANVSIVAASLRYLVNLVSKASWTVIPPKDSGEEGEELAELVEKILFKDMVSPWHRVVRRASLFKPYGFSTQEWTAVKREDGAIGFKDIEHRPQWTIQQWDLDETGTVHGVIQRSPQTSREYYIPRSRLFYIADDTFTDSPEGQGLLRHIAPTAKRLQTLERLEVFGFETDLKGIPIGRAPYAALRKAVKDKKMSETEFRLAVDSIEQTVTNHVRAPESGPMGLLLDSLPYSSLDDAGTPSSVYQYSLELLKGEGASERFTAVSAAIQRLTREIARVVGTEGLLLGESGAGSLAMSKDKSVTVGIHADSALTDVAAAANKDVLNALWLLNGWDPELKPDLRPEKLQHRDVTEVTQALRDLALAALSPEDPATNALRELLGLPDQPVIDVSLRPMLGPDGQPMLDEDGNEMMEDPRAPGAPVDPETPPPGGLPPGVPPGAPGVPGAPGAPEGEGDGEEAAPADADDTAPANKPQDQQGSKKPKPKKKGAPPPPQE